MIGLTGLLTASVNAISNYFGDRNKIKQAKVKAQIVSIESDSRVKEAESNAKIKRAEDGQTQDYNMDMQSMKNMEKSWKDEYLLLLTTSPIIWMATEAHNVTEFITALKTLPMWYIVILIGQFIVIYGLRGMATKLMAMYLNSKNGFKINNKNLANKEERKEEGK